MDYFFGIALALTFYWFYWVISSWGTKLLETLESIDESLEEIKQDMPRQKPSNIPWEKF